MDDLCTLHLMESDPDLTRAMETSLALVQLKKRWADAGVTTLFEYLHMHPRECLLLKDEMAISYEAWGMMRTTTHVGLISPGRNN